MKKKGFTLVELLAVIAILAILVIVAMPNVLGMFNQAKVSSFTTEVQKLMDAATTTFTKDALLNSGKTVYYSSESNATLGTKELDMSGNKKNYFIEMDRNGNFKRVVVYDSNYCYDVYYTGTNGKMNSSKSKLIVNKIEKTSVVVSDVWESGNDSIGITMDGNNYIVNGCEGVITVEGKDTNVYENNQGGAGENGGAPVVYELSGVWVFNDTLKPIDPNATEPQSINQNINFTSNGTSWANMSVTGVTTAALCYDYNHVSLNNDSWMSDAYKTVDFGSTSQSVGKEFYEWFTANAVQQTLITFTMEGKEYQAE